MEPFKHYNRQENNVIGRIENCLSAKLSSTEPPNNS